MNLKEAFRFQNKLQSLVDETQNFLLCDSNIVKVETTYLRKKVMAEAENETVTAEQPSEYCNHVNGVMDFFLYLLQQKETLSRAICTAKATLPIDMDSQTSLNTLRQRMAQVFSYMANLRSSETTVPAGGVGYRFNAEGNQVSYRCDIRKVSTINFDRNKARKNMARLNRQADEMSVEIDKCLINSQVDFTPPFDVNDTFADVFESFLSSQATD